MEQRPEPRSPALVRRLALVAIAGLVFGAGARDARAIALGPLALVAPSSVGGVPLTGTLSLDAASVPLTGLTPMSLTDVSVAGGGFTITLDPTLATPAIGVFDPRGGFTIPTLFLRVDDGPAAFDLAIPNVTGIVSFDASGNATGLFSLFSIDTASGLQVVTITAQIPEPGTALLVGFGLSLVATRSGARFGFAR